jgi:Phospholipase_D-nuclease N-terminal
MTKAVSALPLILYSVWVSIALWDLVRKEAVPNRTRVLWMLVVLVVPLAGADRLLRVRAFADPAVAEG